MNAPKSNRFSPWPYSILGVYFVFVSALGAYITFALSNDVKLVTPDYYQQEIEYESQMNRIKRTQALGESIKFATSDQGRALLLTLPAEHQAQNPKGTIHFYSPIDADEDQRIPLDLGPNGTQTIPTLTLRNGLWRVKLSWSISTNEFHHEQTLIVTHQENQVP